MSSTHRIEPRRVLIAGGGVAGLETLLALRALAGDRLDITLVTPNAKFVNASMSADQPFQRQRTRGLRMEAIADEFGARWHQGVLDRVEPTRHVAMTKDGDEHFYDMLVLTLGAHPGRELDSERALTYHGALDASAFRLLLQQLYEGRINHVAFVRPAGASWPLPLYDLALTTAARCAARGRSGVELSLVTPETEPLEIFGASVSAAVRQLLEDRGVALCRGSDGSPGRPGWLELRPGSRGAPVDRIVTQPELIGPRLRGIACGRDGFIDTDEHGRLEGLDDVFAAGDATTFPVKHGGLAAQQADAVAEVIAARVGADVDPQPFRPILHGVLLTGGPPRYLRADLGNPGPGDSTISEEPLWWPPNKLSARYLAPYLSSQVGNAADVMRQPQPVGAVSA